MWFQRPDQQWQQARCRPGTSKRSELKSRGAAGARAGGCGWPGRHGATAATDGGPRTPCRSALMAPPRTRVLSRFPRAPGPAPTRPPPPGRAGALGTHPGPRSMQPCRLVSASRAHWQWQRLRSPASLLTSATCQAVSAAPSLTCGAIGLGQDVVVGRSSVNVPGLRDYSALMLAGNLRCPLERCAGTFGSGSLVVSCRGGPDGRETTGSRARARP